MNVEIENIDFGFTIFYICNRLLLFNYKNVRVDGFSQFFFMYRAVLSSNIVFRLVEVRFVNVIIDMNNVLIQNSYSWLTGLNFNISMI